MRVVFQFVVAATVALGLIVVDAFVVVTGNNMAGTTHRHQGIRAINTALNAHDSSNNNSRRAFLMNAALLSVTATAPVAFAGDLDVAMPSAEEQKKLDDVRLKSSPLRCSLM